MNFQSTLIQECFTFRPSHTSDARGSFLKIFHQKQFDLGGRSFRARESFLTTSGMGVIRGFHFQTPPEDLDKIVFCVSGKAYDVVVDLRKSSSSFTKVEVHHLDSQDPKGIWIPRGCAHGFQALEANTTLLYLCSKEYAPEHDSGIRWNTVPGVNWPVQNPILSPRDSSFIPWSEFQSPFQ